MNIDIIKSSKEYLHKPETLFEIHRISNCSRIQRSGERLTLPDEELYLTMRASPNSSIAIHTPQTRPHSSYMHKPSTPPNYFQKKTRHEGYFESEMFISHIHLEERQVRPKSRDYLTPKFFDKIGSRTPSPEPAKMNETLKFSYDCCDKLNIDDSCINTEICRRSGRIIKFQDKKKLFSRKYQQMLYQQSPINAKLFTKHRIKRNARSSREIIPQTRAMSTEPKRRFTRKLMVSGTVKEYATRIHSDRNKSSQSIKKILAVVPSPTSGEVFRVQIKSVSTHT
ncbi:unnamed protein product [Blepharisma stoltei]|uniref:Ribosomal protein S10 n=1 Tax=Blepharisma stoltei TaxID=1481888 RepID=A0AAU9IN72_9CILI|nr:unnamed protein product [Blepharisma stoltei]